MILSDKHIKNEISKYKLVDNLKLNQINPASVNLTLGNTFLVPTKTEGHCVTLGDEVKYSRFEVRPGDSFILKPGQFALATTQEKVNLPDSLAAFVQGRSSIGRIGLTTQNAGFVDPGFHGHITLELVNESPNPIALVPGYPVAQLVFIKCYRAQHLYCGKYNGQVEATGSRMHMDQIVRR